jgi:RNA polymerase sigma-70 factor (ECF subfamily)
MHEGILQPAALPNDVAANERVEDPTACLAAVYRDYPGLRALILRRVRDPDVAADILQDAAVTTLEKLRSGEIAHPENVGGYLYRVALNHLRNHRRKDRSTLSSSDGLESLAHAEADPDWERVGHPEWAAAARRTLDEMATVRDRELLVRFYLNDEAKESICSELGLSDEHFNRVIFRARNRFRALLERRGFGKSDFLALAAIGLGLAAAGLAVVTPDTAVAAAVAVTAPSHASGTIRGAP